MSSISGGRNVTLSFLCHKWFSILNVRHVLTHLSYVIRVLLKLLMAPSIMSWHGYARQSLFITSDMPVPPLQAAPVDGPEFQMIRWGAALRNTPLHSLLAPSQRTSHPKWAGVDVAGLPHTHSFQRNSHSDSIQTLTPTVTRPPSSSLDCCGWRRWFIQTHVLTDWLATWRSCKFKAMSKFSLKKKLLSQNNFSFIVDFLETSISLYSFWRF